MPLQSLQGWSAMVPSPLQSSQALTWLKLPNGVLRVMWICPVPLQVAHVSCLPSFAPVPSHVAHVSSFSKSIFLVTPNAASVKLIARS